ncbi:hypothetical protein [Orenia marismortui]|uniref:hypothetical protein n=1 Tax=Orenia marismortui TaxID=46469 RepID=UPI00036F71F9|nr:hypothetical protein [Orenia marismortui]
MIIWSGAGILVPIVTFLSLILSELSIEFLFNSQNYYQEHGWPKLVGFLIAGVICKITEKKLNKNWNSIFIDKETGEEVVIKTKHTFFFITMEMWGMIMLPIFGIAFLFVRG